MTENPSVNRYLRDKSMDHIDHALGRPFDPMGETYRNYFAIGLNNPLFYCNPHWELGGVSASRMAYWHVTEAGRAALAQHLRDIRSPDRRFAIEFRGFISTVISDSASKARYRKWLDLVDVCPDLTFGEFQRYAKVRLA